VLEYWFYSPGSVNQIVFADTINWAGWDQIAIPFTRIGGSGDWQYHSLVVNQTASGARSGIMFFDDAIVYMPTAIEETGAEASDLSVYPNPAFSSVTVTYTLKHSAEVSLDLFTSDGRKAANIFRGRENAGSCLHHLTPAADLPAGNYIVRLEARSPAAIFSSSVILVIVK
jgi:hypothetical protein